MQELIKNNNLTNADINIVHNYLNTSGGYVSNFTNNSFDKFIFNSIGEKIYSQKYDSPNPLTTKSKANRLTRLLEIESNDVILQLISELKIREDLKNVPSKAQTDIHNSTLYNQVIQKLSKNTTKFIELNKNKINRDFSKRQLDKIDKRMELSDYEGVITSCKSLIDDVFVDLHFKISGTQLDSKLNTLKQFRQLALILNLDANKDREDIFNQMLSSMSSMVQALAELRNKSSDGHSHDYLVLRHHAKLTKNLTFTLVEFLYDTAEYQKLIT